jgi:fructan beta-fructosidase
VPTYRTATLNSEIAEKIVVGSTTLNIKTESTMKNKVINLFILGTTAFASVPCMAQQPDKVQTDPKAPTVIAQARREFKIEKRYLNLPIKNGAPKPKVTTLVNGRVEVTNEIELADGTPDWWAPMDVGAFRGKTVTLQVDKLPDGSKALSSIEQSDSIQGAETLYDEPLRGQLHFSSKRGWNNDPNGMVLFNGEYHLFYQHNPYGWGWGNMHWGHAISRDLVRWQELGDVLFPDELGPMFSGSAVVDWTNTSGLGSPGRPAQVLIYTAAGHPTVQCLASSIDGRNYTKFSGNPVVREISDGNRDPKVMWHEPTKQWVMVLYVELDKVQTIHFLSSPNLKDWHVMGHIDGFFECPDFFELALDGDRINKKWVLTAASSDYMVGSFDGTKFMPETPKLKGHRGQGFYAAQTFSDIPSKDGRRIQIGWLQTETKGMSFNQSMSLPHVLGLIRTPNGPRLTFTPVKELETLRGHATHRGALTLKPGDANPLAEVKGDLLEIRADLAPANGTELSLVVRGVVTSYNASREELTVAGLTVPAPLLKGRQRITIYADRTCLEVFASDGLVYIPLPVNLSPDNQSVEAHVKGGTMKFYNLEVYNLDSTWK